MVLDAPLGQAWDVTATPGKPTPMHRHRYDFVGVELADTAVTVTTPDGKRRTFPEKRGDAYFLPKGTTHIEETPIGYAPRRSIIIELKDGPGASPRQAAAAMPAAARVVVDNARVTMRDVTWTPGAATPAGVFPRNTFIIFVDGGEVAGAAVTSGQVLFEPAGSAALQGPAEGAVRGFVIELK